MINKVYFIAELERDFTERKKCREHYRMVNAIALPPYVSLPFVLLSSSKCCKRGVQIGGSIHRINGVPALQGWLFAYFTWV